MRYSVGTDKKDNKRYMLNINWSSITWLSILFCILNTFSVHASPKILAVTEDYPPNSIILATGEFDGFLIELTNLIFEQAQLRKQIMIIPWARAYKTAVTTPNTLIFGMRKTQKREKQFKWAGPVFKNAQDPWSNKKDFQIEFLALKENKYDVNTLNDLKKYNVSSIRNDALTEMLLGKYHWPKKQVLQAADWEQSIQLMLHGRADFVAGYQGYVELYLQNNSNTHKLKSIYKIPIPNEDYALHYAFNFQTSDSIVKKFIKARDLIMSDGRYDKLLKKWQKKLAL